MLQLASSLQPPTWSQGFRDTTQLANARRNTQAESIVDTNKRWLSNPDKDWLNSSNITQLQHLDPPLSTLLWRTHRWPLFTILTSTTFAPTDTKKYSGVQYLTKTDVCLWEGIKAIKFMALVACNINQIFKFVHAVCVLFLAFYIAWHSEFSPMLWKSMQCISD